MNGPKKKSYLAKGLKDYANCSTVHGISYVFDETIPVIERVIWLIIVLTFGCVAVYLVCMSYQDWQDNQVITTLKTVARPVSELQFPAITICGPGQHLGMVEKVLTNNFQNWNKNRKGSRCEGSLKEDFAFYMKTVFQIDDKEVNIMDILRTMISPNPEATGANAVRGNQVSCSRKEDQETAIRRKRTAGTNMHIFCSILSLHLV